jgi:DNA-directed RNA polymerase specialized sigma24 family protein
MRSLIVSTRLEVCRVDGSSTPFLFPWSRIDLAAGEQRRMLRAALADLPEKERTAVILRDFPGVSETCRNRRYVWALAPVNSQSPQ